MVADCDIQTNVLLRTVTDPEQIYGFQIRYYTCGMWNGQQSRKLEKF